MSTAERFERARRIADAVLYEGYVLYPYRASSAKNHVRFQWGVAVPRAHDEANAATGEWATQTECVIDAREPVVDVRVRFLHVQERRVEAVGADGFEPVDLLEIDDRAYVAWDEAVEVEVDLPAVSLDHDTVTRFERPAVTETDEIVDATGRLVGRFVRERAPLAGVVRITGEHLPGPFRLWRMRLRVENETDWRADGASWDEVARHSLVSVHSLLALDRGEFVSQVDPPEFAKDAVNACVNQRTWPVLVGEPGDASVLLSSPIILYDYPEVAPESGGDFFDALEIDELLALRVMTLTDEEKREARGTDARAAEIVERVDTMPDELFERLHGAVRSLRSLGGEDSPRSRGPGDATQAGEAPWWDPGSDASVDPWNDGLHIGDLWVARGTRVRLRPLPGADAQDLFVAGRTAVVEGVFRDVDDNVHVAVTVEDHPAAEEMQWHGRYLYFRPEELEAVDEAEAHR